MMSMSSDKLKDEVNSNLNDNFRAVGYTRAKEIIFKNLDNEGGEVCCVYSNRKCLRTSSVPDHKRMNVEHTWPQSKGAVGDAKSDLHHLFPSDSKVNSTRSNFPFCEVSKVKWTNNVSKQGTNKFNEICFEPPTEHKGNVARAEFYFSVKYNIPITEHEEAVLRQWHQADPVDQDERERNQKISNYQGNVNLFVEYPELVDHISNF